MKGKFYGHDATREGMTKTEHVLKVSLESENEREKRKRTNMFRTNKTTMTDVLSCFVASPFKLALNHSLHNMLFSL